MLDLRDDTKVDIEIVVHELAREVKNRRIAPFL